MGPLRSPLSRVVVVVVVVVVVDIGVRRLTVANGPNIFQMILVTEAVSWMPFRCSSQFYVFR